MKGAITINIAEHITNEVLMTDVLEKYGFSLGRNNFMCCPFHNEKTPSFKVYSENRKFKCFGCGEGGSVIDFVMKYFELNFKQAIEKINADFGLGLSLKAPSRYQQMEMAKIARQKRIQREAQESAERDVDDIYCSLLAELNYYTLMKEQYKHSNNEKCANAMFVIAVKKISKINYMLDLIEIKRGEIFGRENSAIYA